MFIVGSDMAHPKSRDEAYFQDKITTRRHLEKRIKEDPSLGYTYVMVRIIRPPFNHSGLLLNGTNSYCVKVGLFSEYFFEYNILGLSEDRKSASFIGDPKVKLTTTLSTEYADVLCLSTYYFTLTTF